MIEEIMQDEGQSINPTDSEESSTTDEMSDVEAENLEVLKQELAKQQDIIRQLTARAKKAEAQKKRTDLHTPEVPPTESVDERILKSQGMTDELLKELKKVARFNETDLISAQYDPMFLTIKQRMEQEQKDKEAALGASKGAGAGRSQKTFTTTGLKEEDHKELWRKAMGQ